MCGFVGAFGRAADRSAHEGLSVALSMIAHRGPDSEAIATGDGWWLGFRRLSILDIAPSGNQPMGFIEGRRATASERPTHWLVFNGEIYNYRELAQDITVPRLSHGDSETLGCLLSRDGVEKTLPRLRGMFAFLWYDVQADTVQAARDPFGIKPLYYRLTKDGIAFASEMRALLTASAGTVKVDRLALASYLRFGAVYTESALIEGTHSVPAGHSTKWQGGRLSLHCYFTPRWESPSNWITNPEEARERLHQTVTESMELHLRSDVPVGLFLSAGLDSNIVAAMLRRGGHQGMKAFHIGYKDATPQESENAEARQTAEWMGASYEEELFGPDDIFERLPRYFGSLDQPSGDALNSYLASELAARHVKVVISAVGPDEWIGGYRQYQILQAAAALPLWKLPPLQQAARHAWESIPQGRRISPLVRMLAAVTGGRGATWPRIATSIRRAYSDEELRPVFGENAGWPDGDWFSPEETASHAPGSWLNQTSHIDTHGYLQRMLLRDADSVSMAHSLELRVPFIDPEVFRITSQLAPGLKRKGSQGKAVLREAFTPELPPWILDVKRKKTFTVPLIRWLRTPQWESMVRDRLRNPLIVSEGLLPQPFVDRAVELFYAQQSQSRTLYPVTQRLWLLFVLENWLASYSRP